MTDELTPQNLSTGATEPSPALYSVRQVCIGAFLGGAAAGGWLLSKNFGALGDDAQRKSAIFGGLLLTAAGLVGAMRMPTDFSNSLIPLIMGGIFAGWYRLKLQAVFATHRENGGAQASWWKAIGISVAAFVATVIIVLIVTFSVPILPINHVKDGPNIIYYEGDATRQNAESLARFFRETGVFNESSYWELTLLIPKDDSRRVVIKLPYPADIQGTSAHDEVKALAALLEERKYIVKDVEIHVQNAFGLTTLVVKSD